MEKSTKIKTFGLSVKEQRLYIGQLDQLFQSIPEMGLRVLRKGCPMAKADSSTGIWEWITLNGWSRGPIAEKNAFCDFCRQNVDVPAGCPCRALGETEALRRGRKFIERWDAKNLDQPKQGHL